MRNTSANDDSNGPRPDNNAPMPQRVSAEAVLIQASRKDRGERWRAWQKCGADSHLPNMLPQTSADGPTPMLYCPCCWTLFTVRGDPVNTPDPANDPL
jgi:hypothetical protein